VEAYDVAQCPSCVNSRRRVLSPSWHPGSVLSCVQGAGAPGSTSLSVVEKWRRSVEAYDVAQCPSCVNSRRHVVSPSWHPGSVSSCVQGASSSTSPPLVVHVAVVVVVVVVVVHA
jgi:hypothetical protein